MKSIPHMVLLLSNLLGDNLFPCSATHFWDNKRELLCVLSFIHGHYLSKCRSNKTFMVSFHHFTYTYKNQYIVYIVVFKCSKTKINAIPFFFFFLKLMPNTVLLFIEKNCYDHYLIYEFIAMDLLNDNIII